MWETISALIKSHATASTITLIAVLGGIFEVSKIPINPWGWLFGIMKKLLRRAGRIMTEDVQTQLDDIKEDIKDIKDERISDRRKRLRRSILRFADECRMRQFLHSKEMFNDVLNDIDMYRDMCGGDDKVDSETAEAIRIVKEANHKAFTENTYL